MGIDVRQHLANANYSRAILMRRVIWQVLAVPFRCSPRFCYGWRNFLLRLVGARIGRRVRIYPDARIMFPWNLTLGDDALINAANLYSLAPITIASDVMISQGAHLCAGSHDPRQPNFPLVLRPITIASGTWLAAECFIGPGVTVGAGAVVGARAVVMRDVPPGATVVGNPARVVNR